MDRPFRDPSTVAARRLLSRYGVAAVYTSLAGLVAPDLERVWLNQDVRLQVGGYDSTGSLRAKTIECISADIAGYDQKGYFTIGGTDYHIVDLISDDTERIMFQVRD